MATKIIHKRSSTVDKVPVAGDLSAGELALNTADAKIYMKNDAGTIVDVTASIYKKDTNVTVTDTGTNGTITTVADGVTVGTMTSTQTSFTQNTAIENAKLLQLKELSANGVNFTGIKAADSLAASYNLTLPTATGLINQLLKTDGSGQLGWTDSDTFGSNRVYVSATKGNDANDGITAPVLTIKRALQIASGLVYTSGGAVNGVRINVIVSAGDYYIDNPVIVPDNVTVKGDSLRSVNIRPLNAGRDLLRVRNGCYFGEVTFRDGLSSGIPSYTFSYAVSFDDPLDTNTSRVGYTYLPTSKPLINQSPYIQNCTLLSFLGASGVLVDGSLVVTPNTPTNQIESENPVSGLAPEQGKSMVANAFTMLSFGGTGWRVINDAYVQLVSCFQIFMLNGTYTQSGGYCSITNSATNFGLYALRASGFSPNSFVFDRGYIGTTGTTGSIQTITAFGWTRVDGPVEEFIIQIYDPSTTANLTNSYKTALGNYLSVSFNAATAINTSTDTFTVVAHGLLNQDQVSYESNGGTQLGNIYDGDIFYVKKLTSDTFQLYYDNSLTKLVDITFAGVGTQNFIRQDYELYVDNVTETHNVFQDLVLAAGSPSGYTFVIGDLVEGTTAGFPSKGYVYNYVSGTRTLTLCINKVTIGITETRNVFAAASTITQVAGVGVTYTVSTATARTDLYGADFEIAPTILGGTFTNTATLPGKKIYFHRPSVTNSSGHTWEYAGSGTDYNALPQNGGKTVPFYEQVSEQAGRVYTSGTNELGDFKVGNFITAFNRTGNVTFTNKITVDTLDVLRLGVGGVTVESISIDPELGNNEPGGPKDTRISTQLANYTYFQTHLGNVLDKSVSTNAIPGSLVQLNSNGQINSDLIPTSRSFTSWTSNGIDSRLYQVDNIPASDILSGDIATENFYQQELTLSGPVTAPIGSIVIQTTGNTATTAITSGSNTFTVTHSGAVTLVANTYVLIEGATPSAYNGVWKINRAAAGTFTVFTTINPGTATVQGTIYYGGASGITKAEYTSTSSIIVGSVGANFNTPFTASANTLIIGTDRTPSDTNTSVNPSAVTSASSTTNNYFLRVATTGQYLITENTASPVFTNGTISKAFRYNNNAYITSTLAHNFVTNNEVKIDAATASFDLTTEVTVTSSTEFYYTNTAADSATSASTTATATLAGASSALTMTGSVAAASLTGTITVGDFVFDVAGTIPKGSKITAANMAVDPRTFTVTFPATSTVASTTTATLKFFTPASETGTIRSVLTAADNGAQSEFLELRAGVITSVNNLSGLTGGTLYTNGVYYNVPLTNVSGSGVGALADITVASGAVTGVDIIFGGANYAVGNALSATSVAGGFGNGTGSGFQILVNAIEKRIYTTIFGGETFVATSGAPDFVEDNAATQLTATATATVVATFNAASTGSGGGVDTVLNRITTLAVHGFTTGDPVLYDPGSDPAVGGLTSGNVYYVKVITTSTIELYNNYSLGTIQVLTTSTGSGHTFTRKTVDIVNNSVTVPAHGFITGDAFQMKGASLPDQSSVQITSGRHFFVGSITTNSFSLHELRSDALDSTAGVTINAVDLTATGSGTITFIKNSVKIIGIVNTSSQTRGNWNSLVATTIDASNIVSGIIATSRLATGTANNTTFLRGDSTWQTVVTSAQVAASSALTLTGSGSSPFYGSLTFDVTKVNSTGAVGNYTAPGVASFNTVQFSVGTGSSLGAGQVLIKDNVIDAGTLQTKNLAYVLDSANHTTQPVSVGGTGLVTYTQGDMLYASATTTLNKLGIGVTNTVMTSSGTAPQWSPGLTIAKSYDATGASITTSSTAQAFVFDTNAKVLAIGSAATSVVIGSNTVSESFTSNVKSYTTSGSSSTTVTANIGLTGVISTVARNGSNVATITTTANHGLTTGDIITVVCTSDAGFNAVQTAATVTGLTTFTYADTGSLVTTVAGTGSVFIGAVGMTLGTTTVNADTYLAFGSSPITAGVRVGMLVQGNTFIPAGTTVSGVDATRVYLSAAVTGIISSGVPIAFTDTNTSMGIRTGDQVTIASSGVANIDGTWPVTTAGATSTTFNFKVTTATTQTNLARAGTIVKAGTIVLKNRNVTLGSSEASTSPVAATLKGENGVGTNIAGASFTVRPGLSTGNATGGVINFQTGTTGTTGDTTQTAVTRMALVESSAATTLDLTTAMTTANVFNSTATTVNFAGAATTLAMAHVGTGARIINVATAATGGASTLTFGGAVTGNIIKLAGTTTGTINLTTDVTSGIVNQWQSVTGTINIGASGTVQLGTSAGAITTVQVGGAITGNILKIAGTAAGTANITSDVTTGTVNIVTGVTTGTINLGSTSSTLAVGTLSLNGQSYESSSETTGIVAGTPAVVSSFAFATYRSAKYILQVTCTAGTDVNNYQLSEVLVLHNGTSATMNDYGVIRTGNNLVTFTAAINGANLEITAAATTGNTIKVRVVRTLNTI
jgi:hypothetical protein